MKILIVLTQYKRKHLENQLTSITQQTLKPDYLVVFQNENHEDISHLKDKFDFIHIKSDYNTKFFGRFAACFTFPVDICIVLDDDIIPGKNCIQNYVTQCIEKNGIIGGNGRYGYTNKHKSKLTKINDTGYRKGVLVDFCGHLWCFKKEWLHYMFTYQPYTYDTGEDIHFCYSAKILGNINTYLGEQLKRDDECDLKNNRLARDIHSSCRTTKVSLRINIEKYFIENYKLELITHN